MTVDVDDTKQKAFLLKESTGEDEIKVRNCERRIALPGAINYIVVVGCFLVQFIVLGMMNNVGILKTYWEKDFNVTSTHAALPGSINYGFMFVTGIFSTALEKRIGFANLHCLGCVICALALFCASLASSFQYVIASFGVMFGIGASFAFFATLNAQFYYFGEKIKITNGIISAGSGCGTMILSLLLRHSFTKIGWRNTLYVMSAVMFVSILIFILYRIDDFRSNRSGIIACLFAPTTSQKNEKSDRNPCVSFLLSLVDLSPLKNIAYVIFVCSCIIFMLGYMIPFLYIRDYATSVGIEDSLASKMVGTMSIASLFGKILIGNLTMIPNVNAVFLFQVCFLIIGITSVLSRFCSLFWHFMTYSIIFGFFEGGYVALTSLAVNDILGLSKGSSGIGLLFAIKSIPIIVAGPLTGILHSKFNSFRILMVSAGSSAVLASSLLSFIWCVKSKDKKLRPNEEFEEDSEKKAEFDDDSLEVTMNKDKQVV